MVRIATLTVAVGMAVMIVALAVIGGFKKEVTDKLVGFGAHIRITALESNNSFEAPPIHLDSTLMDSIARLPRFASISPYALKGGIIKTGEAIQGVALKGFGPGYDTSFIEAALTEGSLPEAGGEARKKELLISRALADMLMLEPDDRVEMLFISADRPVRRDRFKVSGIYSSGMEELDRMMVFTDIRNIQRLNGWDADQISGYEVMTTDFAKLDDFTENVFITVFNLADTSAEVLRVDDVVSLNPNTFDWLRAHNMNAAVVIIIMLLVALLNMISALLIILLEKTSMIGTLKALGMTNGSVIRMFLYRSLRIVFTGMLWGNIAGLGVALLQKYTGLVKLDSSGYILSQVPVEISLDWWAMLNIGVPLVMLVLLTIPAMVVSGIKPDRTMRYQ